jgi:hypothetical protein
MAELPPKQAQESTARVEETARADAGEAGAQPPTGADTTPQTAPDRQPPPAAPVPEVRVSIGRIEVTFQAPTPVEARPVEVAARSSLDPFPAPPPPAPPSMQGGGPAGTSGFEGYAWRRRGRLR